MKSITRILLAVLAFAPASVHAAGPLSGTAGGNLTSYNPGGGVLNNNEWNSMMNSRSSGTSSAAPTADFGNCNSVILRCASPKCASGGCTTMEIATPIVAGCVAANSACSQYGDALVQAISAQLVASSTAKANAQNAAAEAAAAAQTAQQMQQMQAQMQQMQESMAAQNAEQIAQLQSALEEQKQMTAQAIADAAAAQSQTSGDTASNYASSDGASGTSGASGAGDASGAAAPTTVMDGLTEAQKIAAQAGVSADILAREQVAGEIMTSLENARVQLNKAKAAMELAFEYGGCTADGSSCDGPKRVAVFRQKALEFFDPYDAVLDELYDALITAQSVGIDITDIYMMLNGSCNVWGEYLCYGGQTTQYQYRLVPSKIVGEEIKYERAKDKNGKDIIDETTSWAVYDNANCQNNKSKPSATTRGGMECKIGAVIPPEDSPACTLNRTLTDMEKVQRNFLFSDSGYADEHVRIGCASSALEGSKFFRNRKKQSSIDIEILKRIVSQDAPTMFGSNRFGGASDPKIDGPKYCAVNPTSYMELQKAASLKTLPARICVTDKSLAATLMSEGRVSANDYDAAVTKYASSAEQRGVFDDPNYKDEATCAKNMGKWDTAKAKCSCTDRKEWVNGVCIPVK